MNKLVKVLDGNIVFPNEFVGVRLTPDNPLMYAILRKLAAYEAFGYEPEQIERILMHAENACDSEDDSLEHQNDLVFLRTALSQKDMPTTAYGVTLGISQEEANIINGYINDESAEPQDEDDRSVPLESKFRSQTIAKFTTTRKKRRYLLCPNSSQLWLSSLASCSSLRSAASCPTM